MAIAFDLRAAPAAGSAAAREDAWQRLQALTWLLDSAVRVPGTGIRVGLDALIGLVPGIGDAVSGLISAYLIWEARRLGAPRRLIARMVANVMLDTALGAVPVVGDAWDAFFRANRRNLRLLARHLGRTLDEGAPRRR